MEPDGSKRIENCKKRARWERTGEKEKGKLRGAREKKLQGRKTNNMERSKWKESRATEMATERE